MKKFVNLLLVLSLCVCSIFTISCKPKMEKGEKTVTITVNYITGEPDTYSVTTSGYYVKDAMDKLVETTDFTYSGSEGQYGFYLQSINGVSEGNGYYWVYTLNGDYALGVSEQTIYNGDIIVFSLEYYG